MQCTKHYCIEHWNNGQFLYSTNDHVSHGGHIMWEWGNIIDGGYVGKPIKID